MKKTVSQNEILVVTGEGETRGWGSAKKLKVEELSVQVNLFLGQMNGILGSAPKKVGTFQFVEFEVYAEINAKGALALLGTGGEAGAKGGVKFVFRRSAEG
jgi:hypothetical protein